MNKWIIKKASNDEIPKDIKELAKEHYNDIKQIIKHVVRLPYSHIWQVSKIIETYGYKTEVTEGAGYLSYIKVILPHASGLKIHQNYSFQYEIECSPLDIDNSNIDKTKYILKNNYAILKDGIRLN